MTSVFDPIERMQKCIDSLDASDTSGLSNALNDVRAQFAKQALETKQLGESQADAIVYSAEIIGELEETKDRLEESRLEAESATRNAKRLSAFGDILENSLNEIFIFDAETLLFVHVNHGARENIGYSMEELREMTPVDIKASQTAACFAELVAPLLDGSQVNLKFKTKHQRKDSSEYPVQIQLEMSFLGDRRVFAAVILDITERQKMEQELLDSREQALIADRTKSNFLANMSHEIRTPMTAILGFSDILLEAGVSEKDKQDAAQTIHQNGHHLLELINDILDLSKIESGKIDTERRKINPGNAMQDVVNLLSERAKSQGNDLQVELRGDIPQTIQTDPTKLKQALVNLVGNALKFTKNDTVRIIAECDRQNEWMKYHVIDSGIGITSDQMDNIFQPFKQADSSTTRKYGGTGLGLTITKRIANILGGDVSVESEPGRGSTFTLTIATGSLADVQMQSVLETTTSPKTTPWSPQNAEVIDGRVLLVEDGPDNQRLVSYILKKAGAKVTLAANGKEGVEAAMLAVKEGKPFGVILMDMQMPVMDGYTATSTLRDGGYSGQIVALTAHAMKHDIDKCLESGCDSYLSKPIDRYALITEVAGRMGSPSTRQSGLPETAMK
ncbi:MAG: response regulator [Planctomycetaceae bacterium]|nr:response regulator [Planctomycetaceae bacterium]